MSVLIHPFEKRGVAATICVLLVLAIGLLDYVADYSIFFSAFYLVPVGLAVWFVGQWFGIVISILSVVAWLAGDFAAGVHYSSWFVPAWNTGSGLAVYIVVVKTLGSLRKLNRELEKRVQQRTVALANEMEGRKRLERELLEISERGQRQVGHELHDVLGQHLTATAFASQVLTEQLENKAMPESAGAKHVVKLVESAITLTRTFARGLQPVEMEPQGLMHGFQELARVTSERFKVSCEFECRESVLLAETETSTQLYRIAQEAITNAIRHGKAREINVSLEQIHGATMLTITDDGVGLPDNAQAGGGMGLRIMAYRADMIGATFNIERMPESGTRVTCTLPNESVTTTKSHGGKN